MSKLVMVATKPLGLRVVVGLLLVVLVAVATVAAADPVGASKKEGEQEDKGGEGRTSRWEHKVCYMVVSRPYILVRVHSGSYPDERWIKQPVDKNGFEHTLCHYGECNSLSIDTCKRLLEHFKTPDEWGDKPEPVKPDPVRPDPDEDEHF